MAVLRSAVQDAQVPARLPAAFDSIEHVRAFFREFFGWYNHTHRHSGIGLMTPATVHYGRAEETRAQRGRVLDAAYAAMANSTHSLQMYRPGPATIERPSGLRPTAAASRGRTACPTEEPFFTAGPSCGRCGSEFSGGSGGWER